MNIYFRRRHVNISRGGGDKRIKESKKYVNLKCHIIN